MNDNYSCYETLEKIQNIIDLVLDRCDIFTLYQKFNINKSLKRLKNSLIEQKRFIIEMKAEHVNDEVYDLGQADYLAKLKAYFALIWGCYKTFEYYYNKKVIEKVRMGELFLIALENLNQNIDFSFDLVRVLPVKPYLVNRDFDNIACDTPSLSSLHSIDS
ncbi:hypothetical protein K502DRAFT_326847 [Neoconidiobolus thromboides FSU 785]|nr:hypothetical protein K502DRAFT_326847 [Neoconidiobolus thromboides FSU 785]